MTTPERPSLADTIARIDAALAEQPPRCTLTGHRRDVGSTGPFTAERCTRDALPDSPFCAAHKRIPREMIEELGPVEPVVRDGNTFTINQPGVYEMTWNPGGSGEPSVAERALEPPPDPSWVTFEKPGHLPGPPGPTCPGCAARDARPGWLARALRRLFT